MAEESDTSSPVRETESETQSETSATPEEETEEDETVQEESEAAESETEEAENSETAAEQSSSLVVYFSATGNTQAVAEELAAQTGADIYEIVPEEPYTDEDLNYNDRTLLHQWGQWPFRDGWHDRRSGTGGDRVKRSVCQQFQSR